MGEWHRRTAGGFRVSTLAMAWQDIRSMCPLRSRLPSMQTQDWGKGAENITHVRSAIFSNESDETLNRAIHQLQRHSCDIPQLVKTDRTNHGNGFFARGSKQAVSKQQQEEDHQMGNAMQMSSRGIPTAKADMSLRDGFQSRMRKM